MKVEWSESASSDLEAIRAYIARDSRYYAASFIRHIVESTRLLGEFPDLGQVVREFDRRIVREKVLRNYRILYEIQKNRVVIIAIVHAARNLDSIALPERN